MSFAFPPATLRFLGDLRENNTREWFDAHRDEYEAAYVEPARAFVTAVGPALAELAPGVRAEPRVLGSIFRINRDTRFSRDKRPYKDHLDMWFWEGDRKASASGFMIRLTPDHIGIGAGGHHFAREALERFRAAAADPAKGGELAGAVADIEAAGIEIGGERYKRMPPGYDAEGPGARFLRHDGLHAIAVEPPTLAVDPQLLPRCMEIWTVTAPLHRWIVDNVQQ